jgi:phosphatidylglycerol:prolipoprotein diacylglycerol transferase
MGGRSDPVVPTQLIEAGFGFVAFAALAWLHARRRFPGQVILMGAALYAVFRFIIEYWRGDPQRGMVGSLSTSQAISAGIAVLALAFWIRQRRRPLGQSARASRA